MNLPAELSTTRRALHAVAELLIAGPQYEAVGDIRLAARPGGFGGWVGPTPNAVSGTDLITPTGRFPLGGSVNDLARRAGITPRALRDVYTGGPDFSLEEPTDVTASAAEVLLRAFTDGDAALRSLDPGQMPILWPEHFDIGISVAEVNYGVSPGDAADRRTVRLRRPVAGAHGRVLEPTLRRRPPAVPTSFTTGDPGVLPGGPQRRHR